MSKADEMNQKAKQYEEITAQGLARIAGVSLSSVYKLAKKMNRLPTVEEIQSVPMGRPRKYKAPIRYAAIAWKVQGCIVALFGIEPFHEGPKIQRIGDQIIETKEAYEELTAFEMAWERVPNEIRKQAETMTGYDLEEVRIDQIKIDINE